MLSLDDQEFFLIAPDNFVAEDWNVRLTRQNNAAWINRQTTRIEYLINRSHKTWERRGKERLKGTFVLAFSSRGHQLTPRIARAGGQVILRPSPCRPRPGLRDSAVFVHKYVDLAGDPPSLRLRFA